MRFPSSNQVLGRDAEATLEAKAKARVNGGLSKRAMEILKWTDDMKIDSFKKYELVKAKPGLVPYHNGTMESVGDGVAEVRESHSDKVVKRSIQ